jgi:D-sedoheptulose 7-phosphate isomerase
LIAADAARAKGIPVLALSAKDGGALKERADLCIVVPTTRTDRAQEIHLCIQHAICDAIEATL